MQISIAHITTQTLPASMAGNDQKLNRAPSPVARLWVGYDYFCRTASKLSEYNKRHFKSRSRWNINQKNEINLFSVPAGDRVRYGIAIENSLVLAQVEQLRKEDSEEAARGYGWSVDEKRTAQVYELMAQRLKDSMAQYRVRVASQLAGAGVTVPKERVTEFAKKWAVWEWIMTNYSRFNKSLEIYHAAYSLIFPNHFTGEHGKINFRKFYSNCEANGVEHTIIDKRTVVKVTHRRSPVQMAFLQTLFIQNRKISAATAAAKLVEFCKDLPNEEKPMSHSNVKIIFREFANNHELYYARYGEGAAQKQASYASLIPALHRNTEWQIDGWTLPFWGEAFQRYVLYMIRDNHSRKIVGYSVAETENTTLILEGLDDAMRNTGIFPGELISDKHSFHKTTVAARLRAETEKLGAVWTVTINAQRNGVAERYNQYMDAICKEFDGYLGKNMTATSKDARPSPEALAELARSKNWKTADEIKAIAAYAVVQFNRATNLPASLTNGIKQTPNERYDASESIKAFAISEADRMALIKPVEAYKVIRGQITIKVGMRKHEFVLSAALIDKYNNQSVEVTYEDLTEGIYVSDIKSGEMLGFIKPKVKIHGAIPDQTEADKVLLNKLAGKKNGTATKARKTAQQRIADGLKDNPDAIALINTHALPKDIRQIAQQDAEVKRHLAEQGAKMNMVPSRKTEVATITMPVKKAKKKPFAPDGTVKMGKVDISALSEN